MYDVKEEVTELLDVVDEEETEILCDIEDEETELLDSTQNNDLTTQIPTLDRADIFVPGTSPLEEPNGKNERNKNRKK